MTVIFRIFWIKIDHGRAEEVNDDARLHTYRYSIQAPSSTDSEGTQATPNLLIDVKKEAASP